MVPELMGQHVRLSRVPALRPELLDQLVEEGEVEVDPGRTGRAVERADRRRCAPPQAVSIWPVKVLTLIT